MMTVSIEPLTCGFLLFRKQLDWSKVVHALMCMPSLCTCEHHRLDQTRCSRNVCMTTYAHSISVPVSTVVNAQHLAGIRRKPEGDMLPVPIMRAHFSNVDQVKQLHTDCCLIRRMHCAMRTKIVVQQSQSMSSKMMIV